MHLPTIVYWMACLLKALFMTAMTFKDVFKMLGRFFGSAFQPNRTFQIKKTQKSQALRLAACRQSPKKNESISFFAGE